MIRDGSLRIYLLYPVSADTTNKNNNANQIDIQINTNDSTSHNFNSFSSVKDARAYTQKQELENYYLIIFVTNKNITNKQTGGNRRRHTQRKKHKRRYTHQKAYLNYK